MKLFLVVITVDEPIASPDLKGVIKAKNDSEVAKKVGILRPIAVVKG